MSNRPTRRAEASDARKANARGEVKINIGERELRLKLTLGVLADVEDEFNIESLDFLPNSGKALLFLLERMAKAAGDEVTQDELRAADIDLATVMEAVSQLSGAADAAEKKPAAPSA